MTTRLRRQDNTLIWVLAGGGIALVLSLFAIVLIGVGLFLVLRSPVRRTGGSTAIAPSVLRPASTHDRLVGTWVAKLDDGSTLVMELRPDGRVIVTDNRNDGLRPSMTGSWGVVSESGKKIRFRRALPGQSDEMDLEFDNENTIAVLEQGGHWLIYRRK
jgi:hypothetical protein